MMQEGIGRIALYDIARRRTVTSYTRRIGVRDWTAARKGNHVRPIAVARLCMDDSSGGSRNSNGRRAPPHQPIQM
jgi:hypothetical protein